MRLAGSKWASTGTFLLMLGDCEMRVRHMDCMDLCETLGQLLELHLSSGSKAQDKPSQQIRTVDNLGYLVTLFQVLAHIRRVDAHLGCLARVINTWALLVAAC